MVSVRAAKQKGSNYEYDCQESLEAIYPDIYRTAERGYQREYDLRTDNHKMIFECKRLKSLSWNQAVKFYRKLQSVKPLGYTCYLLFKSNRQPCLVMCGNGVTSDLMVIPFEQIFAPFLKHKSTRRGVRQ